MRSDALAMRGHGSVPRERFETALLARTAEPYVAVRAKHSSGRILGTSESIEPGS